jgi:uncharacterized protein (TIGR02145 family)
MKKTIFIILVLLAVAAICADRIGFSKETKIDNLYWMTRNVGGNEKEIIGDRYTFEQAQTACPEGWRLPTKSEFEALIKNCSKSVKYKDQVGRWFTGSEFYSQSMPAVFFPRTHRNSKFDAGFYWTSTPYDKASAYALTFNAKQVNVTYVSRNEKLSIRCVK